MNKKGKHKSLLKRSIVSLTSAVLCALLGWSTLYYFSTRSDDQRWILKPHPHENLLLAFSGTLDIQDASMSSSEKINKNYSFEGEIEGDSKRLKFGNSYECLFRRLVISNTHRRVIFGFERLYSDRFHYYSHLPLHQREEVYRAFNVDLSHHATAEDKSLLQQPFHFFLGEQGQIKEFSLPKDLKNVLYSKSSGHAALPIITTFFSSPDLIPPLLPKNGPSTYWISKGSLNSKLKFITRQIGATGSMLHFETKGSGKGQKWEILWDYNPVQKIIPYLSCDFFSESISRSIGDYHASYHLKLNIEIYSKDKNPHIREPELVIETN